MFGIIELLPFLFVGLILQWLVHLGQKPDQPAASPDADLKKAMAEYLAATLSDSTKAS
jgi:hypothetical protein